MPDDHPSTSTRMPLAFAYDRSAAVFLVPLCLVGALTLNIAALTIPFMEIRIWPDQPENYSIPHTVRLMWTTLDLPAIAILIAGFSLVFPFLKLGGLAMAWFAPTTRRSRGRLLAVLGALGRWSLLDVFVALVLVVLAHDQGTLFVTGVKAGLGMFLAAILLAMATGDVLHALHEREAGEAAGASAGQGGGDGRPPRWVDVVVLVLAVAAAGSLAAALTEPYLKITAWFLSDREYSIVTSVEALAASHEILFAIVVAAFLAVTPAARIGWIVAAWAFRGRPATFQRVVGQLRLIERWAMLDVFGLAVALFLLEGSHLIPIEARGGVWLLVIAVAASIALARTASWLVAWPGRGPA